MSMRMLVERQASRHHNVCHHAQYTHNIYHCALPNIVAHRIMAANANSIISDPTLPTLPTAWSLIDYAVDYKEIQQLLKLGRYSQSFGQGKVAELLVTTTILPHDETNMNVMLLSSYLLDFTVERFYQ